MEIGSTWHKKMGVGSKRLLNLSLQVKLICLRFLCKFIHTDPTPSSSNDVVLVPSLATLLPPEDARLLSKFSATHEGFLLSEETHPPIIRRLAYENFTSFLKFLNSHTTLALLTTLRASVCDQLQVLRYSGFKGEWFYLLVRRLDHHHYPYIAEEDLKELTQLEAVYSQQTDALLKEIQVLSRKLHELNGKYFAGKEALEHIFYKKQQIMKDRKSLDVPFTF